MGSKSDSPGVTCITCGKHFSALSNWRSESHSCFASLVTPEDISDFEEDQLLDIESRAAALAAKAKLERWVYEKLGRQLELSHATKAEVVSAYNSLSAIQKHAVTKHFEYTERELDWAVYESEWVKEERRPEKIEARRVILEEDKKALLEASKSATGHILLLRGVNPRLIKVIMEIQDNEARRVAIRELLKSLK
jgi:hypothetical protein